MAIDDRNFSIEGVQSILSAGEQALLALNANNDDNNLLLAMQRIKEKISFLQKEEEKVLSLFPTPNDRESIRSKIAEYNQTMFPDFFGVNLRDAFIKEFLKSAESIKGSKNNEQNLLAEYIIQQLIPTIPDEIKKSDIPQWLAQQFNGTLMTVTTTNKGSKVITSTKKLETVSKDQHIIIEKLTPAMRDRLQEILDNFNTFGPHQREFVNLSKVQIANFQTQKDSLNIKISSEWLSETRGLTSKQIEENVKKDPATWDPIVQHANEAIINMLTAHVASDAKTYFRDYLKEMTDADHYLFFVGVSATDVTGLLGEITTVLAIQKLTGKTVPVEWVAHNVDSKNKKVSIDVVLNRCLGINIKNTTENFSQYEGFHNVSFVDRNPQDVFDKLLGDNSYNEDLSDAFQTSYFNKSYQIKNERPHVVAGSNPDFNSIMVGLLDFRQKLIDYLYQFTPELMYMETDNLEKQLLILDNQLNQQISGAGNILYMVGGIPFFPSEMLSDLLNDLKQLEQKIQGGSKYHKSFFFDISKGNSEDIIKVLNEKAIAGQSVRLSSISGYGTTIQLKTSWIF